jgi:phosphoglycerate dehydrogenase-like enzyme
MPATHESPRKLLIFPAVDKHRCDLVHEAAAGMSIANAADAATALREIVDADAFFGKITPELLAAATRLDWVQSPTASLEHYLFPELIEHPCRLSNMRGLFSDVIADHVMGFVLCFARNLHRYLRLQQQARWAPVGGDNERSTFAAGPAFVSAIDRRHLHLADCTLGVVGVGNIGAEICRRAAAFGMTVHGVDPVCESVSGVVNEVWPTDRLPDLLAASDFVVIAAPHTPETFQLFRSEQFRRMKPTAYLINIGRGVIVDLADLAAALQTGEIAGAGLDVFETEPLPADHPLWRMENVIITPHVAAASPRIAERHLATLLENVRRFAAGQDPATLVDKRRWF